jgi:ABC-type antimicrobial peptide transport system permease subunit
MALGAQSREVRVSVLRESLVLVLVGVAVGLPIVFFATRFANTSAVWTDANRSIVTKPCRSAFMRCRDGSWLHARTSGDESGSVVCVALRMIRLRIDDL